MTTKKQEEAFLSTLLPNSLLDEAIDWIASNLNPEDVFSDNSLEVWAENNGYTKE